MSPTELLPRGFWFVPGAMLVLALAAPPTGYVLLWWFVVCPAAVLLALHEIYLRESARRQTENAGRSVLSGSTVVLAVIAFLFPWLPVFLSRDTWAPVHVGGALFFWYHYHVCQRLVRTPPDAPPSASSSPLPESGRTKSERVRGRVVAVAAANGVRGAPAAAEAPRQLRRGRSTQPNAEYSPALSPLASSLKGRATALDEAIASVAVEEYERLADGMTRQQQAKLVDDALESLGRLQKGVEPDYGSRWVALFYLTWYQPRQIHLAYVMLRELIRRGSAPRAIVDYGSGARAVQFALALICAESPQRIPVVRGVDTSEAMLRMGEKCWQRWIRREGGIPRDVLRSVGSACSYHATVDDALGSARNELASGNNWLTALHAAYAANLEERRRLFAVEDHRDWRFVLDAVTFYGSYHRGFFRNLGFRDTGVEPVHDGTCFATTAWRQNLAARLSAHGLQNRALLRGSVPWWRVGNVAMIRRKPR